MQAFSLYLTCSTFGDLKQSVRESFAEILYLGLVNYHLHNPIPGIWLYEHIDKWDWSRQASIEGKMCGYITSYFSHKLFFAKVKDNILLTQQ